MLVASSRARSKLEAHHLVDVEPAVLAFGAAEFTRRLVADDLAFAGRDQEFEGVIERRFAAPGRGQRLVDRLRIELRQQRLHLIVAVGELGVGHGGGDELTAERHIALPLGFARGAADGGPRPSRHDESFPGGRTHVRLRRFDHHFVAVAQLGVDRHVAAVDEGGNRLVADVGVHGVGEVQRRRPSRQGDETAFGREAEDLIVEQLELGVLQELLRVFRLKQRADHGPQTPVGTVVAGAGPAGVAPLVPFSPCTPPTRCSL